MASPPAASNRNAAPVTTPPPALSLGRVASLHPLRGRALVATDLPLRLLRWPVGTGSRVAFRRAVAEENEAPAVEALMLETTVRAIGTPARNPEGDRGANAADPVLVFAIDAPMAEGLRVGDTVWLVA